MQHNTGSSNIDDRFDPRYQRGGLRPDPGAPKSPLQRTGTTGPVMPAPGPGRSPTGHDDGWITVAASAQEPAERGGPDRPNPYLFGLWLIAALLIGLGVVMVLAPMLWPPETSQMGWIFLLLVPAPAMFGVGLATAVALLFHQGIRLQHRLDAEGGRPNGG